MRIQHAPQGSATVAVAPSRPRSTGSARFGLGAERSGEARRAGAAASLATLDAILALQGEEQPGERRRRSARRGRDVLDSLDALRAAILGGGAPTGELARLARHLADLPDGSGDPGLDEVLAQISLRAQVELAKLGQRVPG